MEHNPYAAPQAKTETSFLAEVAPRPIAVWLLIFFLLVFVLIFVVACAQFLGMVVSNWSKIRSVGLLAISLAWRLGLIAVSLAVAYGAYRRRSWSRWVGVAAIVGLSVLLFMVPDTTRYANDAERAGGFFGRFVIMPLLLAWWAYAVGFSLKAKRYFSKNPS